MKAVNRSSGLNKKQFEIFGAVAIGLFAFSLTAFLGSSLFSPKDSHAETDISAIIENDGGYTLSATSAQDTVEMNISATPEGTMGLAKNSLNVKSNAPNGYKVFVAMDDATSNDLVKDTSGETTPVTGSIDATSGTFATPATLDLNSWGFAITKGTTGAPSNNFSTVYNPEVPDKTTMWAGMPLKGEDQLLQTIDTPDNTTGIDLDVYYGVNADITKPSGVYKGAVTYTAVAMTNAGATEIASISPNKTSKINGGEAMTISTLYTFTAAQAIDASNPITVTIGGKACTGTGTDGAIALADLSNNADGYLVINCTAPANNSGKYDLNIKIPKYGKDIVVSNAVQYWVDTANASNLCESLSFDPTNLKVNAASAYYGQANCDLSDIANLNVYDDQWDDSKTAAQNTADAGLTYDTNAGTLTIEEGYHVEQQVNSQSSDGQIYYLGTGRSTSDIQFDVKSLVPEINYTNLTNDNFIVGILNVPRQNHAYRASGYSTVQSIDDINKNYDINSGILTVSGGNLYLFATDGGGQLLGTYMTTVTTTKFVYLSTSKISNT